MRPETAEDLIAALRGSGLFTPEQFARVARELAASGSDLKAAIHYLHRRRRLTYYQIKKVLQGKSAELFIGPYVITDKLGVGGMGKVFRAHRAGDPRRATVA